MKNRSGMLLIAVLACLVIVSSLAMTGLTSAVRMHRETRRQFQLRQSQLLIDSAIARARHHQQTDPDYAGETWSPTLPDQSVRTANVLIEVNDRSLDVKATIVDSDGFQTQRSDSLPLLTKAP